jgi:hypothetical protein
VFFSAISRKACGASRVQEDQTIAFLGGQIIDTEFDMKRDPVGISCDDPERLETWKSAHSFQSKWIVE